ncbi:MAG TPA: hypothetical protein VGR11_14260, partial [Solirubrobacteraceae bacterium]|nr:hypothetical protein [Solirubrobacteraceae bacterium]
MSFWLAALAAAAALAVGILFAGCGGRDASAVEQVRVLRLNPGSLVTKQPRGGTAVRAALT